MKNKFSYIGLLLNFIVFIFYSSKIRVFGDWPQIIFMMGGVFYFFIIAIVAMVVLWWLIRLSWKRNESKPVFLANCIFTVLNSFSLLYPYIEMLIVMLSVFGFLI